MDLKEELRRTVFEAASAVAGGTSLPPVNIDTPKARDHGDYACNIALILAKPLGRKPVDIAGEIVSRIPTGGLVSRVEVRAPGFINFWISDTSVTAGLRGILEAGESYGCSTAMQGRSAIVEFVSANPTGPLHIGHARNAAVGDCICRALENVGCKVHREYYFNDAGAQMKRLGDSVRARYLQIFLAEPPPFPEDAYHGDYVREIAEQLHKEEGESWAGRDWEAFARYAERIIVGWIDEDLEALSIRFDLKYSEVSLHQSGKVDEVLAQLKTRGFAYESEGALWLRTTDFGDEKDRVLVKGDGDKTYLSPDIAYHDDKYSRGFDLVINLLGADHHSYAQRLKAAMSALGHDPDKLHCIIYQLVTVRRGGEVVRFSKRAGDTITLREMIEELSPDVIRFFFAMRKADSHMEFDWDLAKEQSDKNPVFYVQYAHARCCSIERKAAEKGVQFAGAASADLALLNSPEEQKLIRTLYEYPRVVEGAGINMDPQRYTAYLRDVAEQWNAYQHAGKIDEGLRIIRPDNPELTQARLALAAATRQVLRNALHALGCSAPERMERTAVEA